VIYEIDLGNTRTSGKCVDCIFQVAFKTWIIVQDRSDLLEAVRDLVRPQATLGAKRARRACRGEIESDEGKRQ
jgi:hypothetical protein